MYAVQVQIVERIVVKGKWHPITEGGREPSHVKEIGRQIPTFYLDENVQGFQTEAGCVAVALDIIRPRDNETAYVTVARID